MAEFKPCPFCGGINLSVHGWADQYWVDCADCETEGPSGETMTEAIQAWNRRYTPSGKIDFDYEAEDV